MSVPRRQMRSAQERQMNDAAKKEARFIRLPFADISFQKTIK